MSPKRILAIVALFTLSACGMTMTEEDFKNQQPALVLEEYFDGRTYATGLFEDRFGNVRTQFSVVIDGKFENGMLILDEDFTYTDGTTEFRRWEITKTGPQTYTGTTENAIGEAVGRTSGNSFHWEYKFNLDVGEDRWKVRFDDWMFLQPNGVLLNKATVYRWGIKIGTVFISFSREEANESASTDSEFDLAS